MLDLPRLVLVPAQDARHDLDVVVLRERLAELREQVRGRLDAGPVVLIQDENSTPGHGIQASRDRRRPLGPRRGTPRRSARSPSRARAPASGRPERDEARGSAASSRNARAAASTSPARDERAVLPVAEEIVRRPDSIGENERETARRGLVHHDGPGLPLREEREHVRRDVQLDDPLPVDVARRA